MRKFYLILLSTLFLLTGFATPPPQKHAILIGIDGARRDAFNKVLKQLKKEKLAPHLFKLINSGTVDNQIYAGGDPETGSLQFTFSEPGWVSILTGVWAVDHHIHFNGDLAAGHYNPNQPTLYNLIKHKLPFATTASFSDWQPLQQFADFTFYGKDAATINEYYPFNEGNPNKAMTEDIVTLISGPMAPTFTFIHYMEPDETGHLSGFTPDNPAYLKAITEQLLNIDKLAAAIKLSEKNNQEWLVIITTDHGGHGNIHGTQDPQDRDIFAVFYETKEKEGRGIKPDFKGTRGQTTFASVVLNYLTIFR